MASTTITSRRLLSRLCASSSRLTSRTIRPLSTSSRPTIVSKKSESPLGPISTATMATIPQQIPMRTLDLQSLNQKVVSAQYAVRGELAVKAERFRTQLRNGDKDLPFDQVISANIGNPQQLGQKPITFFRQVLSILEYPDLLKSEHADKLFPPDVIERAQKLLKSIGSIGAYSHSQGVFEIRQSIAKFLEERDGFPAKPEDLFLTVGASAGVSNILTTICRSETTGILIPVPQYPLYTATLSLLAATPVPYFLNEATAWSTDLPHIREEIHAAKANGIEVRCIVIINPGNPTGACLTPENIRAIIDLARDENLVVLADEVYQTNVFAPNQFTSFKKVLCEAMRDQPAGGYDHVELVSLHSTSKGMVGECGHRGGYFELVNFRAEVHEQIYKLASISLCPPVIGQALVELMVQPPRPGDASFALYDEEYNGIARTLQQRALKLYTAFNKMSGVSCNPPEGAMYLFPTIRLPERLVAAAEQQGKKPDEFYCLRLLEATGVCVVPGSGFGQREGEWHFRTTFLAGGDEWVERIVQFHEALMREYA